MDQNSIPFSELGKLCKAYQSLSEFVSASLGHLSAQSLLRSPRLTRLRYGEF